MKPEEVVQKGLEGEVKKGDIIEVENNGRIEKELVTSSTTINEGKMIFIYTLRRNNKVGPEGFGHLIGNVYCQFPPHEKGFHHGSVIERDSSAYKLVDEELKGAGL